MIRFLLIAILLSGCDEYRLSAGTGVHSNNFDDASWQHDNPIGYIEGEANTYLSDTLYIGSKYEHTSVIYFDDSTGFNYIGAHVGVILK